MDIKEYWARLVASGLAPDWESIENIIAIYDGEYWVIQIYSSDSLLYAYRANKYSIESSECIGDEIQLRKDGVDLYHLDWRKPTEQDIGKMFWFYNDDYNAIVLANLEVENGQYKYDFRLPPYDCLLASHGQIAPTIEDFKQVYGD